MSRHVCRRVKNVVVLNISRWIKTRQSDSDKSFTVNKERVARHAPILRRHQRWHNKVNKKNIYIMELYGNTYYRELTSRSRVRAVKNFGPAASRPIIDHSSEWMYNTRRSATNARTCRYYTIRCSTGCIAIIMLIYTAYNSRATTRSTAAGRGSIVVLGPTCW